MGNFHYIEQNLRTVKRINKEGTIWTGSINTTIQTFKALVHLKSFTDYVPQGLTELGKSDSSHFMFSIKEVHA